MDTRKKTDEYKALRRNLKKFVIYNYEDEDEWAKFLDNFEKSSLSRNEKIQSLLDISIQHNISHLKRYGKLAGALAHQCNTLPELLNTINALKINQTIGQNQYQQDEAEGLAKAFYKDVFKCALKLNMNAKDILQFSNFIDGDLSITDNLKKHASGKHDIWWNYLVLLKKVLKDDKSLAADVMNILTSRNVNTIAFQTRKHSDLQLFYLSILNRLQRSDVKADDMIALLTIKDTNTNRVFADDVFEQPEGTIKRDYLQFVSQFEKQCRELKDETTHQLFGIDFNRVEQYDSDNAEHDLNILDAMIKHHIHYEIFFTLFKEKKSGCLFTEVVYRECGYRPINQLFKIIAQLLDKSNYDKKILETFNPAELIEKYGLNASILNQSIQYYHTLLDNNVSAQKIFEQLQAGKNTLILNVNIGENDKFIDSYFGLLDRLIKPGIKADEMLNLFDFSQINFKSSTAARIKQFILFLITLCNEGLDKRTLQNQLCSNESKFFKQISKRSSSPGQIFYQLQIERLIPASQYSNEIRDLVFDHIQTLKEDERKQAFNHIKDKTHPLGELFWKHRQFLLWKLEPSLPKTVADKIKEETGSTRPIEVITETLEEKYSTTYHLLSQSDEATEQQPLLESSIELKPVYINIYDQLDRLPSPPASSALSSQGMYAQREQTNYATNQEKPEMAAYPVLD